VISLRGQLRRVYLFIAVYLAINWILVFLAMTGLDGNLEWIRGTVDGYELLGGDGLTRWRFASAYGHPSWISVVAASGACGLAVRPWPAHPRLSKFFVAWCIATTLLTVQPDSHCRDDSGLALAFAGRRTAVLWACLIGFAVSLALGRFPT